MRKQNACFVSRSTQLEDHIKNVYQIEKGFAPSKKLQPWSKQGPACKEHVKETWNSWNMLGKHGTHETCQRNMDS